jgi:hypothetical protein
VGGSPTEVQETKDLGQKHFPDGKYLVYSEEVKINDVLGKDFYLI